MEDFRFLNKKKTISSADSSKTFFQLVINQENDRTARYAPRDRYPTASIEAPDTLCTIHRHERPREGLFDRSGGGPISRRRHRRRGPELLRSLDRALHSIRREQREVESRTRARAGQGGFPGEEVCRSGAAATTATSTGYPVLLRGGRSLTPPDATREEKRGDVLFGAEPGRGASCFSDERPCVAEPQPAHTGGAYHRHEHGDGTWEVSRARAASGLWYEHLHLHFALDELDWR